MNDIKRTTSLNNFLSFIFYFLFVNTIFSLYVGGFALWLFVFVVFLDRKFLISILTIKKKALFLLLSVFILSSIFLQPIVIFKVVFSYICVRYVFFTMKNNTFYWFHFFLTLNVFICIFQYILFVHAGYKFLDPTYISNALYGSYALTTGDTFAPGFFLEYRVSGLSREPAFLSSLILSAIILLFVQKGYNCAPSSPYFRFLIFIYLLGIVLTFSKVTLALALTIPVAYLLRKFLRALGPDIITILFLILVCIVVYYFYS